ncbi:DUF6585 family protein [Actinomadura macrotermitis]|uniref:Uncharacterized protein n=1 Tax=Actinomadura macrotermitis TaxID=2585200 RepID=A0A7K0BT44_9ACTN|nr:DUF6585 family protein [Actinomadura macrotermitis]MQY04365.1 hypothetical protein [Actinomadura macrotermitis]
MPSPTGSLGAPVRVFDARAGRRRALTWLALLVLAAAVLVPASAAYLAQGRPALGVPAALLALGYLAAAGWIVRRGGLRGRARVVRLHTGGVEIEGEAAYAWADLVSVTMSGVQRARRGVVRWRFDVVAADGRTLRLDDALPDVRALGEAITAGLNEHLAPRVRDHLDAGGSVAFGPFTATPDGITKDGLGITWPAIGTVDIDNGLVSVRSRDGLRTLTATAGATPNALLLAGLAAYRTPARPGRHGAPGRGGA